MIFIIYDPILLDNFIILNVLHLFITILLKDEYSFGGRVNLQHGESVPGYAAEGVGGRGAGYPGHW